ncbi:tapasin-like isoform X1 [Hemicordylus capensis]|uniref:tapasin-like isoform X1 n=1 Tax=Hemicordylus capensis TaxID=884348 RepID=UPI0023028C51|nr:tapasin-like isoform X1 [Hemicordylus capensis]
MSASLAPVWGKEPLLFFLLGVVLSTCSPLEPSMAKLGCWFVEEAGGSGSVMPSALSQRRAMLLLPPPGRQMKEALLQSELPPEVEHGLAFQLLDPSGTLWNGKDSSAIPLWLGEDPSDTDSISCEINAYVPQEAHVPWAAGLVGQKDCPRSLEKGKWFIATVQHSEAGYGVSSILNEEASWNQDAAASGITTATAVLSVFTRTPQLQSRLGQDVLIDCGFSGPAVPFSVEWRLQFRGAGRVILAYDGAAHRISVAEEGAELFLDPESNNVSLRLTNIGVRHEGTYICTVYLPHLHAQQAMELKVVEPPMVTMRPTLLSVAPSAHAELACEISSYYPPGVSVSWKCRSPIKSPQDPFLETWESGHRQLPDGSYSFTSFARLEAVQPKDHGASYSCHVAHVGLGEAGLKKTVKLSVAGSSGPSSEDAIGLFLLAFVLFGALRVFFKHAFGGKDTAKLEKLE